MDAAGRRRAAAVGAGLVLVLAAYGAWATGAWGALGRDIGLVLGLRLYSVAGYIGVLAATAVLARHFLSRRLAAVAVLFTGVSQLANHAVIGWNHSVTTFLVVLGVVFAVSYHRTGEAPLLFALAAVSGVAVWFRYPLAAVFLPMVAAAVWTAHGEGQHRRLLMAGGLGLAVVAPLLLFQGLAYGDPLTTAYDLRPEALPPNTKPDLVASFDPTRLVHTVPSMLVRFDPSIPVIDPSVGDFQYRLYKSSLLETSPYLVLAVVGFPLLYRRRRGEAGLLAVVCLVPVLLYGSWIYFSGGWTTNMRYLSPAVPLLSVMAAAALPRDIAVDRYAAGTAVLVAMAAVWSLQGMTDVAAVAFFNGLALSVAGLLLVGRLLMDRLDIGDGVVLLTVVATAVGAVEVLYLENVVLFYGGAGDMLLFNLGAHPLTTLLAGACIGYGLYRLVPVTTEGPRG